jgi:hypothetical protein
MTLGQYKNTDNNGKTANMLGNDKGVFVVQKDEDGNAPGDTNYKGMKMYRVDSEGNEVPVYLYSLKSDMTSATSDTNVVTVSQVGIKRATIANPSTTITMYVWFGANPSAGAQYVLPPGASFSDLDVDDKDDMRYKSSVAGGTLIYDLRG